MLSIDFIKDYFINNINLFCWRLVPGFFSAKIDLKTDTKQIRSPNLCHKGAKYSMIIGCDRDNIEFHGLKLGFKFYT